MSLKINDRRSVTQTKPTGQPRPAHATARPRLDELSTGRGSALRAQATKLIAPPAAGVQLDSAKTKHRLKVGSNYTDLGVDAAGHMPSDPNALRANAEAEIAQLAAAGVKDLRIWAAPPSDPAAMAQRVKIIGELAQKYGMKVTVDLVDMHRDHATDPAADQIPGIDARLQQMFDQVVKPNAGNPALKFSIGNEPTSAANNPNFKPEWNQRFADWYAKENGKLAAIVGKSRTVAELTPTAVGLPPDRRAMSTIVSSVGTVSLHYYPPPGQNPATFAASDPSFQALLAWKRQAGAQGKPFEIGEFGITNAESAGARAADVQSWLGYLEQQGVGTVRLWQFMKHTAGQVDDQSFDDASNRRFDLAGPLRDGGWIS